MSAFTKAMGGGDPTVQAAVAHDVNRYMENAVEELGDKYAKGQGGKEKSVDGPTGQAYKEEAERKLKAKQQVSLCFFGAETLECAILKMLFTMFLDSLLFFVFFFSYMSL
tara:strand:+ start:76 stop:405 length:330 start_codon:yes stop_codon:yes gene_type:complete